MARLASWQRRSGYGRRIFYRGEDFQSKYVPRQLAKTAFTDGSFSLHDIFRNVLLNLAAIILYFYFRVRLRFSIRHCLYNSDD
jgi:hypothetical protein